MYNAMEIKKWLMDPANQNVLNSIRVSFVNIESTPVKILVQFRPSHDGGRLIDRNSGALFWFYASWRLLKV